MDIDIYPNQQAQWDFLNDLTSYWCLYTGGVGCLHKDTKIRTSIGVKSIEELMNYKGRLKYLSFNGIRYIFTEGTSPFLKGKDYLYRVTHEQGEFVCAGAHRICDSSYEYRSVEELFEQLSSQGSCPNLLRSNLESYPSKSHEDVRHSTISILNSLIYYLNGNHSYDVLLHEVPDNDRYAAPLLSDADKFFQTDYVCSYFSHKDDLTEPLLRDNLARQYNHHDKKDFQFQLDSTYRQMVNSLSLLLHELSHTAKVNAPSYNRAYQDISHAQSQLWFWCHQLKQLLDPLKSSQTPFTKVLSITKLPTKQEYYDISIPIYHNYVTADNTIHHNSGKSYIAARKTLILTLQNNFRSLAVAPTYSDMGRYMVPELIGACEDWGLRYKVALSGKPPIFYVEKIPILLYTGDKVSSIAGVQVGAAWIDEGARIRWYRDNPTQDITLQVPMRLRTDKSGVTHQINVSTTPEGTNTWVYELFCNTESTLYKQNAHRSKYYVGSTRKNKALPRDYAEGLARGMSENLAKQYLEGRAISYIMNRAHSRFESSNIVRNEDLSTQYVYDLGADFNVSPCCWILGRKEVDKNGNERFIVVDEAVMENNATVNHMLQLATKKGWGKVKTVWHLDASSSSRNLIGNPQRVEMQKQAQKLGWVFHDHVRSKKSNPPVTERIDLLDMLICDSLGERKLLVTPKCKKLIDDMYTTPRGTNGYDPGTDKDKGHILDALGYAVYDLFFEYRPKMQVLSLPSRL